MSDGPHKCLPMKSRWKKVAEKADDPVYGLYEVAEDIQAAIQRDFNSELPKNFFPEVGRALQHTGDDLFTPIDTGVIDSLRTNYAAHALALTFLDNLECKIAIGLHDADALKGALGDTIREHGLRHDRQFEETYLQETNADRTGRMLERIEKARALIHRDKLTDAIMSRAPARTARSRQRSGLDEGAPI